MAEQTPRRALPPTSGSTTDDAPAQRAHTSRFVRWRERYSLVSDILTPQRLGLALAAIVLLVTGAFGGLDAVTSDDPDETPAGQANQPLSIGPATITVMRLRNADALPPIASAQAGTTYLFGVLQVVNTSSEPLGATAVASALALDVPGIAPGQAAPSLYRIDDSLGARTFQPGVPVNVVAVWPTTSQDAPAEAHLTLSTLTWYEYFSSADAEWQVQESAFIVTLPVEELAEP
ncbi:MAG: hypothetical protein WAW71_02445 [Propioniciclava sp.]